MPIEIFIPGSKSILNRVLILAALSEEILTIENAVFCEDTNLMIEALQKLGLEITTTKSAIQISGKIKSTNTPIEIYTENAGTTTRFLTALATLTGNTIFIEGNERMNQRPIQQLADALNKLGANVKTSDGFPPLEINNKIPEGGEISIPGNLSSQYISALMMIAAFTEKGISIDIEQEICSKPYIEMTASLLQKFKLNSTFKGQTITVPGNQKPTSPPLYIIEADASSASYFGAYAALNPETPITIKNLSKESIQGDIKFLEYLEKMGCQIKENTITGPETLKALNEIDMNQTPDLVMTFAILAMFAEGTTKITNVANLRIKETDRLSALKNEIAKFGINVETGKDYIEIIGNPELKSQNIEIETYNDHRIAMAFAIVKNTKIKNPECVNKSFPSFWELLKKVQK